MKWILVFFAVVFLFPVAEVLADNFRCPNGNIVSSGDSISTVAAKCDPPAASFRRDEPMGIDVSRENNKIGKRIIYIEVQEWTYNKGSTLLHTLIFRNGVLSEVRTGGFIQ